MFEERIKRERLFGGVPETVHARLEETLQKISEEDTMKKAKLQPILVIAILLILCGAAVAAVTQWSVLSIIERQDTNGQTVVNEEMAQLAQPVNQTVTGEYLRVTMADALFDGRTLAAAWELENLSEDTLLYLPATPTENSIDWNTDGGSYGIEEYLLPGTTRNGGIDRRIYDSPDSDTMHLGIRYHVLAPAVDIEYVSFPNWQDEDYIEQIEQHEKMMNEYDDRSKLLIVRDGEEWLYNANPLHEELNEQFERLGKGCTLVDAMIGTGKFVLLEELDIEFDLEIIERPVSFLPSDEPVELDYEDFTMRVVRADKTPSTVEIIVEAIFPDEETANQHRNDNGFSFIALNEDGDFIWDNSNFAWGANSREPIMRNDGEWVCEYIITYRELIALPEALTVCPASPMLSRVPGAGFHISNNWDGIQLAVQ